MILLDSVCVDTLEALSWKFRGGGVSSLSRLSCLWLSTLRLVTPTASSGHNLESVASFFALLNLIILNHLSFLYSMTSSNWFLFLNGTILTLNINSLAEPVDELQKSYEQFLHRMKLLKERKARVLLMLPVYLFHYFFHECHDISMFKQIFWL